MALTLESSVFTSNQTIPKAYTCQGADNSPPLAWSGVPEKTQSFVLIVDDPDAPMGTWDHWIWFNLDPSLRGLPEAAILPPGALSGSNSWGRLHYGGPCPPSGTHRYYFKLYALDAQLSLQSGVKKAELLHAMDGHVLAQAELMGVYKKG